MDILVDPTISQVPADVRAISERLSGPRWIGKISLAKSTENISPDVPVPAPLLDRWDVQTHKFTQEIVAKVSFLASLFSGSTKKVNAGVVHEAKRYRIEKTSKGRQIEIGVSVRLSVATTAWDAKFDLSIPNLAAQAQLGLSEARIGISVVGFVGAVGDLLPAPEDLNVENFSEFTNAAKEIQKRVFGPDGVSFLAPTVLSFEENAKR